MGAGQSPRTDPQGTGVVAYPPAWRVIAGVLRVGARGSLLVTLAMVLFSDQPPTNPLKQIRLFAGFFLLPEAAAWCIAWAFAAKMRIVDGALVLEQRDQNVEIPVSAIAAIEPWRLPVPRSGAWIRLRSGRRFAQGIAVRDASAFVDALVAEGASPGLRDALDSPVARYVGARVAVPAGWLEHPLLKFVLFSLIPTVPAFRLHQFITYGGAFGEYYTFGLKAYLIGFALWWVSWALGLVLLAAGVRAVVEILALAAAAMFPSYAIGLRRALEILQRLVFYIGMPAWLAARLLA